MKAPPGPRPSSPESLVNDVLRMAEPATVADARGLSAETLPQLFFRQDQRWSEKGIAMRQKELGIWREYTWKDCRDRTRSIALGLIGLGIQEHDLVAILGQACPEWFWSELAVQAVGGSVLGLEASGTAEQVRETLRRFEPRILMAQDQEQVDKALQAAASVPTLRKIVYWRGKGLQHYSDPLLVSLDALVSTNPPPGALDEVERRLRRGTKADLAISAATVAGSGEESWSASHGLLLGSAGAALARNPVTWRDEYVCGLAPSWFFEQALGLGVSLLAGQRLNFAERADTIAMDFREISPQVVLYPTSSWEAMALAIDSRMTAGGRLKKALYSLSLAGGHRHGAAGNGNHDGPAPRPILSRALGPFLPRPLRDKHGLNRARVAYAAGGALSPRAAEIFRALGINVQPVFASSRDGIVECAPQGI